MVKIDPGFQYTGAAGNWFVTGHTSQCTHQVFCDLNENLIDDGQPEVYTPECLAWNVKVHDLIADWLENGTSTCRCEDLVIASPVNTSIERQVMTLPHNAWQDVSYITLEVDGKLLDIKHEVQPNGEIVIVGTLGTPSGDYFSHVIPAPMIDQLDTLYDVVARHAARAFANYDPDPEYDWSMRRIHDLTDRIFSAMRIHGADADRIHASELTSQYLKVIALTR